jgi:hypothetical protein
LFKRFGAALRGTCDLHCRLLGLDQPFETPQNATLTVNEKYTN